MNQKAYKIVILKGTMRNPTNLPMKKQKMRDESHLNKAARNPKNNKNCSHVYPTMEEVYKKLQWEDHQQTVGFRNCSFYWKLISPLNKTIYVFFLTLSTDKLLIPIGLKELTKSQKSLG